MKIWLEMILPKCLWWHYLVATVQLSLISKKCLPHSLGFNSTISHNWINVANFTKDHVPSPIWMEMSKVGDLCFHVHWSLLGRWPAPLQSPSHQLIYLCLDLKAVFLHFVNEGCFHMPHSTVQNNLQQNKCCGAFALNPNPLTTLLICT